MLREAAAGADALEEMDAAAAALPRTFCSTAEEDDEVAAADDADEGAAAADADGGVPPPPPPSAGSFRSMSSSVGMVSRFVGSLIYRAVLVEVGLASLVERYSLASSRSFVLVGSASTVSGLQTDCALL